MGLKLYLLFFSVLILTIFAYFTNKKQLIAPSFLFSFPFLISSFVAMLYEKKWLLQLSNNVYWLIVLSIFLFIIISWVISLIIPKSVDNFDGMDRYLKINEYSIEVANYKKIIIIVIELLTFIVVIRSLKSITGMGDLSSAIDAYRLRNVFSDSPLPLPLIASILWRFSYAATFFFGYQLVKEKVIYKKWDKLIFIIVLLGFGISFLQGNRTSTINLLISMFIFYYILNIKKDHRNKNIIYIFIGLFVGILVLSTFQYIATLFGRSEVSGVDPGAYLAEYLGAEIANLDYFVKIYPFPTCPTFLHSVTFANMASTINSILGINFLNPTKKLLIFRVVNGYDMGNVYTTFMPWLADWGYKVVPLFIIVQASISEIIYQKISIPKVRIPLSILIYGYMGADLFFAFFSNRFFEDIFSIQFLYLIIIWIFLNFIMFPVKLKSSNREKK